MRGELEASKTLGNTKGWERLEGMEEPGPTRPAAWRRDPLPRPPRPCLQGPGCILSRAGHSHSPAAPPAPRLLRGPGRTGRTGRGRWVGLVRGLLGRRLARAAAAGPRGPPGVEEERGVRHRIGVVQGAGCAVPGSPVPAGGALGGGLRSRRAASPLRAPAGSGFSCGAGARARCLQSLACGVQLAGEVGGRLGVLLQLCAQHGGTVTATTQLFQEAALFRPQAAAQRGHQRLTLRYLPPQLGVGRRPLRQLRLQLPAPAL